MAMERSYPPDAGLQPTVHAAVLRPTMSGAYSRLGLSADGLNGRMTHVTYAAPPGDYQPAPLQQGGLPGACPVPPSQLSGGARSPAYLDATQRSLKRLTFGGSAAAQTARFAARISPRLSQVAPESPGISFTAASPLGGTLSSTLGGTLGSSRGFAQASGLHPALTRPLETTATWRPPPPLPSHAQPVAAPPSAGVDAAPGPPQPLPAEATTLPATNGTVPPANGTVPPANGTVPPANSFVPYSKARR